MSLIQIQFSTSTAWQSKFIRKLCRSPFSHVDYMVREGLLGASDSPDVPVIAGNPSGVAIRKPDYQEFGIRRIAELDVPEQVAADFDRLMRAQLGKPFDSEAVSVKAFFSDDDDFSVVRDWREESKWYCSEQLIWGLEAARLFNYELIVAKNRVTPATALIIINPYMTNVRQFYGRIPGLMLGKQEK